VNVGEGTSVGEDVGVGDGWAVVGFVVRVGVGGRGVSDGLGVRVRVAVGIIGVGVSVEVVVGVSDKSGVFDGRRVLVGLGV